MKLMITGSSGYVGKNLIRMAEKEGYELITTMRNKVSAMSPSEIYFDIQMSSALIIPDGVNAVIHLAANTTNEYSEDEESELWAAKRLIAAAKISKSKIIFVSSQTARPNAPTAYGRIKWRIEQEVLSGGGWVVRPGQVYGGDLNGLFGKLVGLIKRYQILPAFIPEPMIQPIHVEDLAVGLLKIARADHLPSRIYCLADPRPISFKKFLSDIAKYRLHSKRLFFPVPSVVIVWLNLIFNKSIKVKIPELQRLQSLIELKPMESDPDLKTLGLILRPLDVGLGILVKKRRMLLKEGRSLFIYLLQDPPGIALLCRYVRAIEKLRGGQSLPIPKAILNFPLFLAFLDGLIWGDKNIGIEYLWRLDAATVLSETTPLGSKHFLLVNQGRFNAVVSVMNAIGFELIFRPLKVLIYPMIKYSMKCRGAS